MLGSKFLLYFEQQLKYQFIRTVAFSDGVRGRVKNMAKGLECGNKAGIYSLATVANAPVLSVYYYSRVPAAYGRYVLVTCKYSVTALAQKHKLAHRRLPGFGASFQTQSVIQLVHPIAYM